MQMFDIRFEKDEETGEYYIPRECFEPYVDFDSIHSYEIKALDDQSISITLYDKDGNVIIPRTEIPSV
jgi:hypothetical protein